ncbi:PHP domain-containing protein [Kineococcus sp. TBRC 1896]|uniref:Histidinol-phosphatase n=1 Tax=Kineococcus mangrovi TaxID=1660183 RepID=A0ABV4I7M1_9ACTN
MLPPDGHVHSQFSWDARNVGAMRETCARAVALDLPSVAFTEHVDLTPFRAGFLAQEHGEFVVDGILRAPLPDADAYRESLDRCRAEFPGLVVLSGREVGQPHLHAAELAGLEPVDRVVGSLHCLWDGEAYAEPWLLFEQRPAADVFRDYLAEVCRMATADFDTFAHLDYPVRSWPGEFDPTEFEEELRTALRALAGTQRCLEFNTRLPLHPAVLRWWVQEGGRRLTFGSDAHHPGAVGHGLAEAGALAASVGFVPGRRPQDPWVRA